ncbi:Apc13p-domain-containing protein [Trematosphaeria pertusa]|uniref:Apc13p-domain-containing protein n=1 Tax=Trematosphaeria pertusa TaxID=390896 RepID=A0A6A6IRD0_9PLEO|nr:Apc13p-domain-containing protein [Trematosphaeria pertusa]KAF2252362.1 Apc13p-domain-containing protein [Trematosphaeria pertusa]
MTRDSTFTHLHLHHSHHADHLEDFTNRTSSTLAPEEIYIPPHLQPLNPEDEDDVVPDQHAAFGIQRATQGKREISWRDLGLEELVRRAPGERMGELDTTGAREGTGVGGHVARTAGREEPVRLALRRRPGAAAGGAGAGMASAAGQTHGGGGGAGNGLPR